MRLPAGYEACHAHTAQRLANEADVPALVVGRVHREVRSAATSGYHRVEVFLLADEEIAVWERVVEQLRKDGFTVRRSRGLSWVGAPSLVVSW